MKKLPLPLWPAALCGVVLVGLGSGAYLTDAHAESKDRVTIQVRLLNDGAPMNEELDLTFEIYDADSGGTLLWFEDQDDVPVRNGVLVARLGAAEPLNGVFQVGDTGADRYVAIKQGGTEIVPRILITAVPYAQGSSAAEVASALYKDGGTPVALALLADELAGFGLEGDNGSPERIRISTSAAGNGLSGGGVSALEVDEAQLINGGDAEVDGDRIAIDYSPTNYTATVAGQALNTDELTAHLKGIDDELASGGGGGGDSDVAQGFADVAGGRLTLSSTEPVPTSDQSNKGTLYYLPYSSEKVSLWNSTEGEWKVHEFTSVSDTVPSSTGNYDVFLYHNGTSLDLDFAAWTNDTTRPSTGSDGISRKEGVWVKGVTTQSPGYRYLGTVRVILDTGTRYFTDTEHKRFVWNVQNRVWRTGGDRAGGSSTVTPGAAWASLDQTGEDYYYFEFVRGLDEEFVVVDVRVAVAGSYGGSYSTLGLYLDGTLNTTNNARANRLAPYAGGEHISLLWRETPGIGHYEVEAYAYGSTTFYTGYSEAIMQLTVKD